MVKIIYLDIYVILRDEHRWIPNSTILVLEQCRKREIQIVICTGRNLGSIQNDVMALQTDGIISGGGCYIQYYGEEVFKEHFSMRVLKKVLSVAVGCKLLLAMEAEQKIFCIKNKISYEENFEDIKSDTPEIHKICIFDQQAAVGKMRKRFRKRSGMITGIWNCFPKAAIREVQ